MKKLAVVVLAAGNSTRMGTIKQLIEFNHKKLLEIVLEEVKKLNNTTFCVLGSHFKSITEKINFNGIQLIENKNFKEGLSSSITKSLNYFEENNLDFDGILFLLGDQPEIKREYLQAMIVKFRLEQTKIIASNYKGIAGVPVIFPSNFYDELKLIKGDKGAKEMLLKYKKSVIFENSYVNLVDLDTKDDLKKYKKLKNT